MNTNDRIHAALLGGFSLTYRGKPVALGKNSGAKFLTFLQMLMLAGDEGLQRDTVLGSLFEDQTDLANTRNSLNNLVYQARKQLSKSDLPEGAEITKIKDRYYWSLSGTTDTDVAEFNAVLEKADAERKSSEAVPLLKKAIGIYAGDLLPAAGSNPWLDKQRTLLRDKCHAAIDRLAGIYRDAADRDALVSLYTEAAALDREKTGDFDAALITALVETGDSKAALRHYNKAIRYYQSQGRGHIPESLEKCAVSLLKKSGSESVQSLKDQLLDIVTDVNDAETKEEGALYCNYPSFIDAVRLHRRNLARDKRPVTLMLLTLVDYEGKPLRMEKKQKFFSEALDEAIQSALRIGDLYTRHDETGFLVLLPAADEENAVAIFDRISHRLREKAGNNASLRYRMLSLNDLE